MTAISFIPSLARSSFLESCSFFLRDKETDCLTCHDRCSRITQKEKLRRDGNKGCKDWGYHLYNFFSCLSRLFLSLFQEVRIRSNRKESNFDDKQDCPYQRFLHWKTCTMSLMMRQQMQGNLTEIVEKELLSSLLSSPMTSNDLKPLIWLKQLSMMLLWSI